MSGFSAEDWLVPQWPAPPRVRACVTTRNGGMSTGPYASLNLGGHVGDDPAAVRSNRVFLAQTLGVQVRWLDQVHGTEVVEQTPAWPDGGAEGMPLRADAVFSCQPGVVCAVLTADCLPVLLCNRTGSWVAAVHAGWRGLAAGVIETTLARHPGPASELLAWLGPAIGPQAFEVGGEVRQAFMDEQAVLDNRFRAEVADCFRPGGGGKWFCNLFALARWRLLRAGLRDGAIAGGEVCTWHDEAHFFSYRRDGVTGRFASLIWLADDDDGLGPY